MDYDPEDPRGKALTPFDAIAIGLSGLLGSCLLAASARRLSAHLRIRNLPEAYRAAHMRLQDGLIRRRIVRLPGSCLVAPVAPWLRGELAALVTAAAGSLADPTAVGFASAAALGLLIGGFVLWASLSAASRSALAAVERDLPIACFLLSLLLESGMGTASALREAAGSIPRGPLARELGQLVLDRSLGVSRATSIERAAHRVPSEDFRLFLNHILQGERLGIGLSRSMRAISEKMLEAQDHRADTVAQQAAVKMLFPLVCFIFPAVFLIILSPVLLAVWNTLLP
jgi:Flp pilus assembly protein TadB